MLPPVFPTYNIGVEIECVLGRARRENPWPRKDKYEFIKDGMNRYLKASELPENVFTNREVIISDFRWWYVKDDLSIKPILDQIPVEIISPKMLYSFSKEADWRKEVDQTFASLYEFQIETNRTCQTHVHLSPSSELWRLEDLHKLGCSILFWESAMETLYDKSYRQNRYAAANGADNPEFRAKDLRIPSGLALCFEAINRTDTKYKFLSLMNPTRYTNQLFNRFWGWNFTNIIRASIPTVEFRRPPGVTQSDTCQNWVDLAVAFVTAATRLENSDALFQRYRSRCVGNLKKFINTGLPEGYCADNAFGDLFKHACGKVDVQPIQRGVEELIYASLYRSRTQCWLPGRDMANRESSEGDQDANQTVLPGTSHVISDLDVECLDSNIV